MSHYILFHWIGIVSDLSIVCPVGLAIYHRKFLTESLENRLIGIYLLVIFLKVVAAVLFYSVLNQRNIFLYNWFGQAGCVILAAIYFNWFKSKVAKCGILVGTTLALIFAIQKPSNFIDVRTIELNSSSMVVWGIGILVAVLSFFYELMKRLDAPKLLRYPMFWLSTGLLLYFSATIFSYIYSELTFNNNNYSLRFPSWSIEMAFGIVLNVFLALAVWHTKWRKEIN